MEGDLNLLQTIIIAIVEGLTEFLPVSSTGHMIIAQNVLGVESTEFVKAFTFIIQFGAILSVVCLYWKRFFRLNHTPAPEGAPAWKRFCHTYDFYWKLLVAFIPAAVLGLLFSDMIDAMLESVTVVAVMLIVGGVFMLFCDKIFGNGSEKTEMTEKRAFVIGLFQCISMIPGVSRSMATIVGGMAQKLTRKAAAEFSFFLAVPTMFAATVYKMAKLFYGWRDGNHYGKYGSVGSRQCGGFHCCYAGHQVFYQLRDEIRVCRFRMVPHHCRGRDFGDDRFGV